MSLNLHNNLSNISLAGLTLSLLSLPLTAQTLATGDTRTVTQPVNPAVCMTLTAQFKTSQRASPPASDDTTRVQNALTDCANTGPATKLNSAATSEARTIRTFEMCNRRPLSPDEVGESAPAAESFGRLGAKL